MEDKDIVTLYFERNEQAIKETKNKYHRFLMKLSFHILEEEYESENNVNDTYLKTWNSIPPHKPSRLSTYLAKITRQGAIDFYRKKVAIKRKESQYSLSLEGLGECIGESTTHEEVNLLLLKEEIQTYLSSIDKKHRDIFICRYFYMDSIQEIASYFRMNKNTVKTILSRTRLGLKEHLIKEGFINESKSYS